MAHPTSAPIRATTQEFLDIEDISEDIVLLKDGSAALIIETSAVNFGLLAEEEQDALIYAYASLLNSLSFPIQISIMSKSMDISSYIEYISQAEVKQLNPILKDRLKTYRDFILSIVKENRVLEKKFYIIIPFYSLELGVKGAFSPGKKKNLPFPKEYILSHAKTSLVPKRDHILRQMARIGLKGKQVTNQQLAELFYNIYNPTITGEKLSDVKGYSNTIVQGMAK